MTPTNPFLAAQFLHVCYVTSQYEHAVDLLKTRCSVSHFLDLGPVTFQNEARQELKIRLGLGFIGPSYVELIEPLAGPVDVYRDGLQSGVPMVWHHVALSVATRADLAGIRQALVDAGQKIVVANPEGDFLYADTRPTMGHYTEYVVMDEQRARLHEAVRKA